jgi:ABC-type multidrug transport system fused ATPase/permease subunit
MRKFPVADPGRPDTRSAARYLLWLARNQLPSIVFGAFWGVCWMVSLALVPAVLGKAIDTGIAARNPHELLRWSMAALLLGAIAAVAGVNRHRNATANNFASSYRSAQVVTRHIPKVGATLPKLIAGGDVVAIGITDISSIGTGFQEVPITIGAVSSICVVAVIMLSASVPLGLTVILGVPGLMVATALLTRPLRKRQEHYRELQADLATRATDIAAGLRVLRGIGGEQAFAEGYRATSQAVRASGVRVARVESLFDAVQVLAPGAFAALVTWLAATFAVKHEISVGSLVAFYGYAIFLSLPLSIFGGAANMMTGAFVAAGRIIKVLRLEPEIQDPVAGSAASAASTMSAAPAASAALAASSTSAAFAASADLPGPGSIGGMLLADAETGLVALPGGLLAVVCADSAEAGPLAERLARFADTGSPTLGGVPLAELPLAQVRSRILLARNDDRLFRSSLRDQLPAGGDWAERAGRADRAIHHVDRVGRVDHVSRFSSFSRVSRVSRADDTEDDSDQWVEQPALSDEAIRRAIVAAGAEDILDQFEDGLDAMIEDGGRNLSGGQQQRLRLARVLAADPETLILVEPTSAVDAHTEARIAGRLAEYRSGRSTIVFTSSPLLLDRADSVSYLEAGAVVASGTHRQLLDDCAGYRAAVTRGED